MDIPFQHGDDGVLKSMNRRGTSEQYLALVRKLREACPEIALRTSFIVGFPGETRQAFENLLSFVEEIRFDRVGAFVYSCEEGTPAADFESRVAPATSTRRFARLMELQQGISLECNREMLGRELDVLVEDLADEKTGTGRSYRDAPEIDGIVTVRGNGLERGEFYKAKITGADEYDLEAETVG
jgi:ribosomal protein S12 methylthiotransferase